MTGDPPGELETWLAALGLGKHALALARHDVDLATLAELSDTELREIGLPLGARLRIRKALAADSTPATTERRQVTVMFCDMVGSSQLAAELDPEDMRRLLLNYWEVVEAAAARHHGYIAQHLGDGALIYFGFPVARENDAERAILAGLDLLRAMSETGFERKVLVQVRLGLATGTVVINQFKGSAGKTETLAIGQSVNFAARLQSLAVPGSLVTDEATRALVDGLVTFEPLGLVAVDGFSDAVPLFKVLRMNRVRSRFEAQRHGTRSMFLGRRTELDTALASWRLCLSGAGRLLLVTGEPGIGKSRFAQKFVAQVAGGVTSVHLQCSPHNASSPFFPVIESLSLMADLPSAQTDDERRARLSQLLAVSVDSESPLFDLFDGEHVPDGDLQRRRASTLSALVELFADMCASGPMVFVVEDLHWCDQTTLEFLDRLLARASSLKLLILATARPGFRHDFAGATNQASLTLLRLGRDLTDDLVRRIFGTHAVSPQLLDVVAERTDGVPLFVEELLKSLGESGAIVQVDGSVGLHATIDRSTIPRSLQSILMARLDALAGAKRIAQVAACIGREFGWELLMELAHLPSVALRGLLAQIAASELIVAGAHGAFESFSFRHALVRDAAYNSLLFSERQTIHGEIAAALTVSVPATRPEILAHHLTEALQHGPAIDRWCEAGEAAKLRSAETEAVEYLNKALNLVEQLPADAARDERELTVLLALIAPLRSARGFAATDVARLTSRAIALADKARDARRILPLLYNRWVYSFVTSDRAACLKLAQDILDRSGFDETGLLRMTGLRAVAATQFTAGDFRSAAENFDASVALYDSARQTDLTHAVGLDGKVTALGYCALTRWCLGERERAHDHVREALATARRIGHPSTIIFAIYHETLLAGVLERDAEILKTNGRSLQEIGAEHGFKMWLICGRLLESLGACLDHPGPVTIGAAEAHFADYTDMGVVYRPTYHAFLAEICLRAGDVARGLAHVREAGSVIAKSGERWNEPELHRLERELGEAAVANPIATQQN